MSPPIPFSNHSLSYFPFLNHLSKICFKTQKADLCYSGKNRLLHTSHAHTYALFVALSPSTALISGIGSFGLYFLFAFRPAFVTVSIHAKACEPGCCHCCPFGFRGDASQPASISARDAIRKGTRFPLNNCSMVSINPASHYVNLKLKTTSQTRRNRQKRRF